MRPASSQISTRRELLGIGAAAGMITGVAPALSVSAAAAATRTRRARGRGDANLAHQLLAVEQVVAFAYRDVLARSFLNASARPLLASFMAHEEQHVAALADELRRLGGQPPASPSSRSAADRALATLRVTKRLSDLSGQSDAVELLIGAEAGVTGSYYEAVARLRDDLLLQRAAQAMAAEAQHATALRRLLHPRTVEKYVPSPFVQGQHHERL